MFGFELKKILFVVLFLMAIMAYRDWSMREIEYPPGVLVSQLPKQVDVNGLTPVTMDDYYSLQAVFAAEFCFYRAKSVQDRHENLNIHDSWSGFDGWV